MIFSQSVRSGYHIYRYTGLDSLSFWQRLFVSISLAAVSVLVFPHLAAAGIVEYQPLFAEINEAKIKSIIEMKTPKLETIDPRVEILREYLAGKNSPMAEYAAFLLTLENYHYVIAISHAEGHMCQKQIRRNNCWGIGGTRPESYQTLPDGLVRANELIGRYHAGGLDTPLKMRTRWVGWHNQTWPIAVANILADLEKLEI